MVLRERKINYKSDNVQLLVSFGLPDVKALLKLYAEAYEDIKHIPHTEQDVEIWFENSGRAFVSWPVKWRKELSKWAFAVAVRNKLLVHSATKENQYFLADCLFARRGRPTKEE